MAALRRWAVASATALLPLVSQSATAEVCPQGGTVVTGAARQDFLDVCSGATAAIAFFAAHGIHTTERVSIEVTRQLPPEAGPSAVGCYIEHKRQAYVLPYAAFRKNKTWFGVNINRAMYQALASHEAAHALAACHFRIPNPTIRAKEYLAYAAMWSSIPPDMRNEAMKHMQVQGFRSLDRFTLMLYLFDPTRFGAEAYMHFSQSPRPAELIDDIFNGRVLTD